MSATITISARAAGRSKPLLADWSIPFPPDLRADGDRITLRDLITSIVRSEVEASRTRQAERRLDRVLTRAQIEPEERAASTTRGWLTPQLEAPR